MIVRNYPAANEFLRDTQAMLEQNEAANNLMLGLALRLQHFPQKIRTSPYLAAAFAHNDPIVAALMTPPSKLVIRGTVEECRDALVALAHDLLRNNWQVPGVLGPVSTARAFAEVWAEITKSSFKQGLNERIYELRKVNHPAAAPGRLRLATLADLELIAPWRLAFDAEALGARDEVLEMARESMQDKIVEQAIYLWEEERPVTMVAKTRPTTHGISVNLVYTPPEFRRRGYATTSVAQVSQLLLDSGWKFCVLFTDLANPTSNSIYQRIGYVPVCDFDEYVFLSQ